MNPVKIITGPSVQVLTRQRIDFDELARFLAAHDASGWSSDATAGDGEVACEVAGRLCYMSFTKPRPGGNAAYLKHIIESGHGSVLEHAVWTLLVTGVSRSLTHELVRHRVGISPSQLSQRYVDESDVAFVVPPALMDEVREALHFLGVKGNDYSMAMMSVAQMDDPEPSLLAGLKWVLGMRQELIAYRSLADYLLSRDHDDADATTRKKRAREAARSVLPNATETKVALTGNARAWRNVLEQRGAESADAEFRRLALTLHAVLLSEAPALFGDYEVRDGENGPYLHTEHRKV